MQQSKGFFASLFDMSFTSFVTLRVIRVLYILMFVFLVIAYVGIAIMFFAGGSTKVQIDGNGNAYSSGGGGNAGLGAFWLLVLGPLLIFIYTLVYRVLFELIAVVFRIYETTREQLALAREINPATPSVAAGHPAPNGGTA